MTGSIYGNIQNVIIKIVYPQQIFMNQKKILILKIDRYNS